VAITSGFAPSRNAQGEPPYAVPLAQRSVSFRVVCLGARGVAVAPVVEINVVICFRHVEIFQE
jgi:hypothetical protein